MGGSAIVISKQSDMIKLSTCHADIAIAAAFTQKKNILLSEEHLVVQWSNKDIVSYICFGNLF